MTYTKTRRWLAVWLLNYIRLLMMTHDYSLVNKATNFYLQREFQKLNLKGLSTAIQIKCYDLAWIIFIFYEIDQFNVGKKAYTRCIMWPSDSLVYDRWKIPHTKCVLTRINSFKKKKLWQKTSKNTLTLQCIYYVKGSPDKLM